MTPEEFDKKYYEAVSGVFTLKEEDWQVSVVAENWTEEVDCNSGNRRKTYKQDKD